MSKIKIEFEDLADFIWNKATEIEFCKDRVETSHKIRVETLEASIQELKNSIALLQKQNDTQRGIIERLSSLPKEKEME